MIYLESFSDKYYTDDIVLSTFNKLLSFIYETNHELFVYINNDLQGESGEDYEFNGGVFFELDNPFGRDYWYIDYCTVDDDNDILTYDTISSKDCDVEDIRELLNRIVSYPEVMMLLSGDVMLKIND